MANLTLQEEQVTALSGVTRLKAIGTLDIATISHMEGALTRIRTGGVARVIVDLQGLEYISSSGLGSFLGVVDHFRREGGDLAFVHLGGHRALQGVVAGEKAAVAGLRPAGYSGEGDYGQQCMCHISA